jgi:hypothetical protein
MQEALHGLRFLWHDPYLRPMASFSALANLALTGVDALIVVFLVRTIGLRLRQAWSWRRSASAGSPARLSRGRSDSGSGPREPC